ncbi:MAG: ribosomal L7Ae/L30e/S12e/Gadd45 family protein [Clostridia bacterium]|nr:ribosomal L7Ae/L30e/S12e/Gadd45 family protein [Clostridia bacterium]
MLGLAKRAGAVIIGTDLVTKALPSGKVKLVIYASDASCGTEKRITDKCKFYNVECVKTEYTAQELSHAVGKLSLVCTIGVTNDNFSKELNSLISKETR